jgi:hypothetical protein
MDNMNRTLCRGVVTLLAGAALLVAPVAAHAESETQVLTSEERNSFCEDPTAKSFAPEVPAKNLKEHPSGFEINYKPLTTPHSGPFADTGKACRGESPTHPAAMGGPGEPPTDGVFLGAIPGASWVSLNGTGSDISNPPPKYYIYDATFRVPCLNQVAGAEITGTMFAASTAGAFLNGVPIGHTPAPGTPANFNGPPAGGWPIGPATGTAGGFKLGTNTVQFVVLDEAGPATGLDFSVNVTLPACTPVWTSNKQVLKEGVVEPVATSGVIGFGNKLVLKKECGREVTEEFNLTGKSRWGATPSEAVVNCETANGAFLIRCHKKDKENITNPLGGGAGVDEVTEWELFLCHGYGPGKANYCPKAEVISHNLPWPTHLIYAPPIRDVIENVFWEVRCKGLFAFDLTGTLMPSIGNSVDQFGEGSGLLEEPVSKLRVPVIGTEMLKGPEGDEKIGVE